MIKAMQKLCEWQLVSHPMTCYQCESHTALIPTVLRTSGTNPGIYLAVLCPNCGEVMHIPKHWKFITDEEDLLW